MANDILIDDIFKDGDFNIGYSDEQHIEHVILSALGHFKQHPLIGVDITQYLNAPMTPDTVQDLEKKIRLQLEADGAKNIKVSIGQKDKKIYAKATYK